MTQKISKDHIGSSQPSSSPAREAVESVDTPVLDNQTNTLALQQQSSAGTKSSLRELRGRFARGEMCKCPLEFQENYRPYNTDYTENQCLICGNLSGRKYD